MTTSAFVSAPMSSPSPSPSPSPAPSPVPAPVSAAITSIPTVPPYMPTEIDVHAAVKRIYELKLLAFDVLRKIEAACPEPYSLDTYYEGGNVKDSFYGLQETDALAKAWGDVITMATDVIECMGGVARVTCLRAAIDDPFEDCGFNYQDKRPIEEIRAELFE